MNIYIMLIVLNLYGFFKYSGYMVQSVSYKRQMVTDFVAPLGSFFGRLLFGFKIKENPMGYIAGFFFQLFVTILFII